MNERDHEAYLNYYIDHPEKFKDEPLIGGYSTIWILNTQKGEATIDNIKRSSNGRRKRWEDYHITKANSLGFEIDLERLSNDMGIIHIYLRKNGLSDHIKVDLAEDLMPPID